MKRWLAPAAVSAVLIAAWFASWYSSVSVQKLPAIKLLHPSLDTYSRPPLASVGPGTGSSATGSGSFRWILYALMGVAGAILLVLAGFLIRMLLRSLDRVKPRLLVLRDRPDNAGQQRGDEAEMLAAVDAGLAELSDSDGDPRRAVIACWVRLER